LDRQGVSRYWTIVLPYENSKIKKNVNNEGNNGVVLIKIRPTKKVGPYIYRGIEGLMKINLFTVIIYECNFRY
jgi:hypothetical protein